MLHMPDHHQWDVFVSYSRPHAHVIERVVERLCASGLRVFWDVASIAPFEPITTTALHALHSSRVLLAYYSADYPARHACQYELTTAFVAGDTEGDPLRRVLVINPEHDIRHIQPHQLRDALLPAPPFSTTALETLTRAVTQKVTAITTPLGTIVPNPPRWTARTPEVGPSTFVGRWNQLWHVHSALHPRATVLTSAPRPPIAVVYGTACIGKTTLGLEYIRRFGSAFTGIHWHRCPSTPAADSHPNQLHVLDNPVGDLDTVRAQLPPDPNMPTLILTRDPGHRVLGQAIELGDLELPELAAWVDTSGDARLANNTPALSNLQQTTSGGTPVLIALAKLACILPVETALGRLHAPDSHLLRPLVQHLHPIIDLLTETGRDILRILTAAAPTPLSPVLLAHALTAPDQSAPTVTPSDAHSLARELLAHGLLTTTDDESYTLPNALALALRHLETHPARAEHLRATTLRILGAHESPKEATPILPPSRSAHDEEEQRSAYKIQNELTSRIATRELPTGQGSLREALTSLYQLLLVTRQTRGDIHPAAARASTPTHPGFGTVTDRLINDILRPFLTYWHPKLSDHENRRPTDVSSITHEQHWQHHDELRAHLLKIRTASIEIANELAIISGNTTGLPQ